MLHIYPGEHTVKKTQIKMLINLVLMAVGIAVLLTLLISAQHAYSIRQNHAQSNTILNSVTEVLKNNEEEAQKLQEYFNATNQQNAVILAHISVNGEFDRVFYYMMRGQFAEACQVFSNFVETVDSEYMYVIDRQGRIVSSISTADLYHSVTEKTKIPADEPRLYNGTMSVNAAGETVYSPIVTFSGYGRNVYTYTTELKGSDGEIRYLVVGFSDNVLSMELEVLKDDARLLSTIKAGSGGFVFCVDKATRNFTYFDDGVSRLSREYAPHFGVTEEALEDGFSGNLTVNGIQYYCTSSEYQPIDRSNPLVIIAAVPESEVLTDEATVALWPTFIFVSTLVLIWSYGVFLQNDFIRTKKTPRSIRLFPNAKRYRAYISAKKAAEQSDSTVRPQPPRILYFNASIAAALGLLTALAVVLVFLLVFFMQTVVSTKDGIDYSQQALNEVHARVNEIRSNSDSVLGYYNRQYQAKADLLGKLMSTNPYSVFSYSDMDHVFVYDDETNAGVLSLSEEPFFKQVCRENGIKGLTVYDEKGRTIATCTNRWDYVLPTEPEEADYSLRQILMGRHAATSWEEEDENGNVVKQVFGNIFYYYTNPDGTYTNIYDWMDNPDTVTRHRGVISFYLSDEQFSLVRKSVSVGFVAEQLVNGRLSSLVLFDNSPEHKVLFSDMPSMVGKTGDELGLEPNVFNGIFNGFRVIDGTRYFEAVRGEGELFGGVYIPASELFAMRFEITRITVAIMLACAAAMTLVLVFHNEDEETAYTAVRNSETYKLEYDTVTITTPDGRRQKVKTMTSQIVTTVKWRDKSPEQKMQSVFLLSYVLFAMLLASTIIYYISADRIYSLTWYIMRGDWVHSFNLFSVCRCAVVFVFITAGITVCNPLLNLFASSFGMRIEAWGRLLLSLAKYLTVFAGVFYCLYLYGINGTSLLASAGIFSVIVGLGAQSLIGDMLAGLFIALEGEIRVGDIVTIGDFTGQVLDIGLRTTKVRDRLLNVKIFNNSTISSVINMTKQLSYAVCEIGIEYDESVTRVERVLKREFSNFKHSLPMIIEGPYFLGITSFGESSVNISVSAGCTEQNRVVLQRELNRAILDVFQRNHISIPYPQMTLSHRESTVEAPAEKEAEPV